MTEQIFFESSLTQTDPAVLDAIKNEYQPSRHNKEKGLFIS